MGSPLISEGNNKGFPPEKKTLQQIFEEVFPKYLNMGMTYEEFWEKDPKLCVFYRKAYKERQQADFDKMNYAAWLQGRYIYDAICAARVLFNPLAKRGTKVDPYHSEPIKFYRSEKERQEDEIRQLRERTYNYFRNMV